MPLDNTSCCGMDTYEGVNYEDTAQEVLSKIGHQWWDEGGKNNSSGIVVFVEARIPANKLAEIRRRQPRVRIPQMKTCVPDLRRIWRRYKLGAVTVSPWKVNPNSWNQIRSLTWAVNYPRFKNWLASVDADYKERITTRAADEMWGDW